MATPVLPENQGSLLTLTTANSIANNAYANSADALRVNNSGAALYVDFWLNASFGSGNFPVGGTIQLCRVDRTAAHVQGPTPSTSLQPIIVGNFNPIPLSGNTATYTWTMSLLGIWVTTDSDFWIYNNGTGFTIQAGAVLTAQPWSPGT